MKKIICAFLLVTLLCSLVGCSVSSTKQYDELVVEHNNLQARNDTLKTEYNDLVTKYDDLKAKYDKLNEDHFDICNSYKDLYARYNEAVADDMAISISLQAIARVLDDNASIVIFDERVIHIMVSYFDGVKEKVEEFYPMIVTDLKTDGYESCIVSVIDGAGKCLYGWTIYANGENDPFLS